MRCFAISVVNSFLILNVFCKNVQHRDPRFIRGTYTSTIIETSVYTSLVPSSCVQVDATLPPCRNVRYLRFPHFITNEPQNSDESGVQTKSDPSIHTTQLGWAEYFGMYAPTVTVTHIEIQTTVKQDPRIVVTFAVKGCRPMKIPMDLDRCPMETSSSIPIRQVLPTSTIASINASPTLPPTTPTNTKVVDVENVTTQSVSNIDEFLGNDQFLEGTSEINDDFDSARATDPLHF